MNFRNKHTSIASFLFGICILFLMFGLIGVSYFVFWGRGAHITVKVVGNQLLSSTEIKEMVEFVLKKEPRTWTASSIEETLELSPYIDSVEVRKIDYKTLIVNLVEEKTYFLRTEQPFIQQVSSSGVLIDEQITQEHSSITEIIPIFTILTPKINHEFENALFSLFQKTRLSLPILWMRLSEISIEESKVEGFVTVSFFSSGLKSKIVTDWPVTEGTLTRVHAIFYFMENIMDESFLNNYIFVQLKEENAVIRYL